MAKDSAGLIMYRMRGGETEVFLVHPGGPFWQNKDEGSWDIPKGRLEEGEDMLEAAKREFKEETSFVAEGDFIPLGSVKRTDGLIYAWAFEGDALPAKLKSNTTFITWPPKSGKRLEIPEVDRGEFFPLSVAKIKIYKYLVGLLDVLESRIVKES